MIPAMDPGRGASAAFIATMNGLEGFTRQAAIELRLYGVRVRALQSDNEVVSRVMALLVEEEEKP